MRRGSSSAPAEARSRRHARIGRALPHGLLLALSIVLYHFAQDIDNSLAGPGRIGPDFWPKLVIVAMGLVCGWQFLHRLLRADAGRAVSTTPAGVGAPARAASTVTDHGRATVPMNPGGRSDDTAGSGAQAPISPTLIGGMALILGYVVAVPWLGFFLTTWFFLSGFAWTGGFRRPLAALLTGGIGALLLVFLFMRVAYLSLPAGRGPFQALSFWLLQLMGVR